MSLFELLGRLLELGSSVGLNFNVQCVSYVVAIDGSKVLRGGHCRVIFSGVSELL